MGFEDTKHDMPGGLGNRVLLSKIDSLRELNVGAMVPLPQVCLYYYFPGLEPLS